MSAILRRCHQFLNPRQSPGPVFQLILWLAFIAVVPLAMFIPEFAHNGDDWERVVASTAFVAAGIVLMFAGAREMIIALRTPLPSYATVIHLGMALGLAAITVSIIGGVRMFLDIASSEAAPARDSLSSGTVGDAIWLFVFGIVCGTVGIVSACPWGTRRP